MDYLSPEKVPAQSVTCPARALRILREECGFQEAIRKLPIAFVSIRMVREYRGTDHKIVAEANRRCSIGNMMACVSGEYS
jgi:hypothetical protein